MEWQQRELKFRAWDKYQKKMIYDHETPHRSLHVPGDGRLGITSPVGSFVYYDTMQYTGLKDKNDVEIYEGDIVAEVKHYPGPMKGVATWEIATGGFVVAVGKAKYYFNEGDPARPATLEHTEVIGNIFENPELLDGDDK